MALEVRRHGYGHTTVADIVGTAGIARNTFYENFPNKEAVFVALLEEGFGELAAAARGGCGEDVGGPAAVRRAAIEAILHWIGEHPDTAHCCLVAAYEGGERSIAVRLAAETELAGLIDHALGRSGAPERLGQFLCGGLALVLARRQLAEPADRAPRLAEDLAGILDLAAT